jgi:hypothetical protein
MLGLAVKHGSGTLPCPGPAIKGLSMLEELRLAVGPDH